MVRTHTPRARAHTHTCRTHIPPLYIPQGHPHHKAQQGALSAANPSIANPIFHTVPPNAPFFRADGINTELL